MQWLSLIVSFLLAVATLSQPFQMEKRRIGMRLPNLLSLRNDEPLVEKRRIGMRLPNIIYLRGDHPTEKKFEWDA